MQEIGKMIFGVGLLLLLVGGLMWSGVGRGWLGRLPGDIHVEKGPMSFHFPWVTCLVISALISFVSWVWGKLK